MKKSEFLSNNIEKDDKSGTAMFYFEEGIIEIPLVDIKYFYNMIELISRSKQEAKKEILEQMNTHVNILLKNLQTLDF